MVYAKPLHKRLGKRRKRSINLLKPLRLLEGVTIGVVAPSHPVFPVQEKYNQGIKNLKKSGFKIKEGSAHVE